MKVRYTPQSRVDVDAIYSEIASANPAAAQRVEDTIRSTIERLGLFPRTGAQTNVEFVRRVPSRPKTPSIYCVSYMGRG